jgi:serine/threonine protein kinase
LSGILPFNVDDNIKLFELIKVGEVVFSAADWGDVSDSAKDLIVKLLNVDPDKRISGKKILTHPWMKEAHDKALLGVTAKIKEYNKMPKMTVEKNTI